MSGVGQCWQATTNGTTSLFAGGNVTDLPGAADAAGDIAAGGGSQLGKMTPNLSTSGYTMRRQRGGIDWTTSGIAFNQAAGDLSQIAFHQNDASAPAGHYLDNVEVRGLLATDAYTAWAGRNGLNATNSLFTDNPDGDSLNNLLEYALGGDFIGQDDPGILPTAQPVQESENQWFEYVYRRRVNSPDLVYSIAVSSSLDGGLRTHIGTTPETGTVAVDAEFEVVTNRISRNGFDKQFIKLVVETTP